MRELLPFVLFILASGFEASAQSPFHWPKKIEPQPKLEWLQITRAQAPPGVGWVSLDDGSPEEALRDSSKIAWIDLNHDGIPAAIVDDRQGGTAGGSCGIYQKGETGKYRCIADTPLGISFCVPYNGYYQIEGWSRAGGGEYTRMLFQFQKGRYHLIRLEDYRGQGEDAQYLESRSPVQNDLDPETGAP